MEKGADVLDQLNGIFAFAIYNKAAKELWLVRDQFGIKPLYYYEDGKHFLFSSELKSFLSFPEFDKTIDEQALVFYLQLLYAPGDMTPFKKVRKLLPGHFLRISIRENGRYEILANKKYYEIPFAGERDQLSEEELISQFEKAIYKSVERQLLSDVPIGFFLSGGVDSSLVAAMAHQITHARLNCFTIDTGDGMKEEGFADDLSFAKIVAEKIDADLKVIRAETTALQMFDKVIWHLDEPQADPAPIHVYNICMGAREAGVKVLLGGTAGDDLFSGYRRHHAIQLEKYYAIMPRFLKRTVSYSIDHLPGNGPTVRRIKKLKTGLQFEKWDRLASYFYWQPTELVEALFAKKNGQLVDGGESPASHFRNLLKNIPKENDDLNRMLYWELKTFLPDHNLNYTDKLSMAASVEARVPFLDKDLVQLSTSLPPHFKMHGKQTKYILKKVAEKYLPREVVYRKKTGFGAPIRKWVRFEMNEMIRKRIHDSLLKNWNIFDAKAVDKLIEDTKNARLDGAYTVWSLLSIESWLRQFTR
jgi:asparagine synthase (glutamine-hydrolysing)